MKFNTRLWGILVAGMPLVCSFSEGTEERFSERLLVEVSAREYHVSVRGNDQNPGTRKAPFRTIGKAASLAVAGDVITVHEGTYRERIDPPRGGEENRPIVYQAAEGEHVEVKGSEIIKGWVRQNAHAWKVSLPNSYWKGFNPYADCLNGDWLESGQWCHTGGRPLSETAGGRAGRRLVPAHGGSRPVAAGSRRIRTDNGRFTRGRYPLSVVPQRRRSTRRVRYGLSWNTKTVWSLLRADGVCGCGHTDRESLFPLIQM